MASNGASSSRATRSMKDKTELLRSASSTDDTTSGNSSATPQLYEPTQSELELSYHVVAVILKSTGSLPLPPPGITQVAKRLDLNSDSTVKSRIYRLRDAINAYEGVVPTGADGNMSSSKAIAASESTISLTTTAGGLPKVAKRRGRPTKNAAALAAIALAALQAGIDNDVRVAVKHLKAKGTVPDNIDIDDDTIVVKVPETS